MKILVVSHTRKGWNNVPSKHREMAVFVLEPVGARNDFCLVLNSVSLDQIC